MLVLMTFTGCFFPSDTTTDYENERKEEKSSNLLSSSSVYYSSETVRPPVLDTVLFDCPKDSTHITYTDEITFPAIRNRSLTYYGGLATSTCSGEITHTRVNSVRELTCNYKIYSDNVLIDIVKISETTTECRHITEKADFNESPKFTQCKRTNHCGKTCLSYFLIWYESIDCDLYGARDYTYPTKHMSNNSISD